MYTKSLLPMVIPQPKANTLITIGWMGDKKAYLNITREEAIKRYCESEDEPVEDVREGGVVDELKFDDEFSVYDAWA